MIMKFILANSIVVLFVLQSLGLNAWATDDPAFLGDAGTDLNRARAKVRERKTQRLAWESRTTLEAYDRIGNKDPRWDGAVRDALILNAKFLAGDCTDTCEGGLKAAFQRAQSVGCTDPLVAYFGIRLGCYPPGISPLDLANRYASAAEHLKNSEYPVIRKCYASVRAAEQGLKAARTIDAAQASDLIDSISALLSQAETQFEELLRDKSANRDSVYDLAEKAFLDTARDTPIGQKQVFDPLAKFFAMNKSPIAGDEPGAGLIEGDFWSQAAWDARGYGWSDSVTPEGWRLFRERLRKAQTILEQAWAADPSDPHIAIEMMTVELGQGLGRARLETWFRRAMDADPDSYEAAHKKMLYLEPKWYGTEEELLEFAHQCFHTRNWESRIPFVLISAHSDLADVGGEPNNYWKRPEVWNDVEQLYTAYLAWNPNSSFDRSHYALKAFRAEKWKLANELFVALGDKPDLNAMKCSMAAYDQMRQTAASKVKTQ
jgi:hypothetical protein